MSMVERMPSRIFVGTGPSKSDVTPEPWFLDPREVLRILRPRWPLVLAPAILLLAAAAAWLVLVPPRYAAVTQILIDPRGIQVVKDGVTRGCRMYVSEWFVVYSALKPQGLV